MTLDLIGQLTTTCYMKAYLFSIAEMSVTFIAHLMSKTHGLYLITVTFSDFLICPFLHHSVHTCLVVPKQPLSLYSHLPHMPRKTSILSPLTNISVNFIFSIISFNNNLWVFSYHICPKTFLCQLSWTFILNCPPTYVLYRTMSQLLVTKQSKFVLAYSLMQRQ